MVRDDLRSVIAKDHHAAVGVERDALRRPFERYGTVNPERTIWSTGRRIDSAESSDARRPPEVGPSARRRDKEAPDGIHQKRPPHDRALASPIGIDLDGAAIAESGVHDPIGQHVADPD